MVCPRMTARSRVFVGAVVLSFLALLPVSGPARASDLDRGVSASPFASVFPPPNLVEEGTHSELAASLADAFGLNVTVPVVDEASYFFDGFNESIQGLALVYDYKDPRGPRLRLFYEALSREFVRFEVWD